MGPVLLATIILLGPPVVGYWVGSAVASKAGSAAGWAVGVIVCLGIWAVGGYFYNRNRPQHQHQHENQNQGHSLARRTSSMWRPAPESVALDSVTVERETERLHADTPTPLDFRTQSS